MVAEKTIDAVARCFDIMGESPTTQSWECSLDQI